MIPAQAVEAAAAAIFGDPWGETWKLQMPEVQARYRADARAALEAAAPHIESAMIEDGWREPDEACCCGMCGL